jgi:hypothetical protein
MYVFAGAKRASQAFRVLVLFLSIFLFHAHIFLSSRTSYGSDFREQIIKNTHATRERSFR